MAQVVPPQWNSLQRTRHQVCAVGMGSSLAGPPQKAQGFSGLALRTDFSI